MTSTRREPQLERWPAELDALEAAPRHHTRLFENESVRVLDAHVEPGDTVPVHTHRWPSVLYVISSSDFVRRDADGSVLLDTRSAPPAGDTDAGTVVWDDALPPHSLENVGARPMRSIMIELKT
jgi:hypothetical protein